MTEGSTENASWLQNGFVLGALSKGASWFVYRLSFGVILAVFCSFIDVTECRADVVDENILGPVVLVEGTLEFDEIYAEHLRLYARRKYAPFLAFSQKQGSEVDHAHLLKMLEEREVVVNQRKKYLDGPADLLALKAQYDAQIRAEFGDTIADELALYLKNAPARGLLSRVNLLLVNLSEPMTAEQIERISRILTNHRVPMPKGVKSVDEVNLYLKERHAQDARIIEKAAEHLTLRQTRVLAQELEFQISFVKLGILRSLEVNKTGEN
jgi:hypothetical protein